MDAERLLAVTEGFYEAAARSDLGRIGALLWQAMGVESGIMYVCEQGSGRMLKLAAATANFDSAARADYAAHYHAINPWFGRALLRRPPYTARGEDLIAAEAFERTEFAADWCRRVGIRHMIGSTRPVAPGIVVGAGIHRPGRMGAFSDAEAKLYEAVTAHAARAVQIAWRLDRQARDAAVRETAAEALGAGVMLLDADGGLVFANRVAERALSEGRWFSVAGGRIRPRHRGDRRNFARLLAGSARSGRVATRVAAGGPMALRDAAGHRLAVFVAPYRGQGDAAALVHFTAADAGGTPDVGALAAAFGLTPAEARLAAALTGGARLSGHAAASGISLNTAKTLLSRVFRKTGTRRQADLCALVASDPVLRMRR